MLTSACKLILMSDPNGLLREITQTKERAAAWVFRGGISIIGVLTCALGWVVWDQLVDLKVSAKEQSHAAWQTIQKLSEAQTQSDRTLAIVTQTSSDFRAVVQDHENRLRALEKHGG
jgi:hypothetical protein